MHTTEMELGNVIICGTDSVLIAITLLLERTAMGPEQILFRISLLERCSKYLASGVGVRDDAYTDDPHSVPDYFTELLAAIVQVVS